MCTYFYDIWISLYHDIGGARLILLSRIFSVYKLNIIFKKSELFTYKYLKIVLFMWMYLQIKQNNNNSTVGTHRNVNCPLNDTTAKHNKFVVNQIWLIDWLIYCV